MDNSNLQQENWPPALLNRRPKAQKLLVYFLFRGSMLRSLLVLLASIILLAGSPALPWIEVLPLRAFISRSGIPVLILLHHILLLAMGRRRICNARA